MKYITARDYGRNDIKKKVKYRITFWGNIRKSHFLKYKKFFKALQVPSSDTRKKNFSKNIRNFLSLGLKIFVSWNIRKTAVWENIRNFFRNKFFFYSSLGWKVA